MFEILFVGNFAYNSAVCIQLLTFLEPYTSQSQFHSSAHTTCMMRLIEENKSKLRQTIDEIEEETACYNQEVEKFTESKDRYNKFLDEKAPLLQNLNCIFNPNESSSNTPADLSS